MHLIQRTALALAAMIAAGTSGAQPAQPSETYLIAQFTILLGRGVKVENSGAATCSIAIGDGAVLPQGANHMLADGAKATQSISGLTPALVQRVNAQIASMGDGDPLDPAFVAAWNKACGP